MACEKASSGGDDVPELGCGGEGLKCCEDDLRCHSCREDSLATEGVFQYSRWDQADQVRDGVRETMATGQVICVLSREIVGSSTSAARVLLLRSMDALSREKTPGGGFSSVW